MTQFSPTDEQLSALDMAKTGNSFKIVAYAGAGKTSTLRLVSQSLGGRGLYLAFNKAIASDAQGKFAPHVKCQTFHSLAFRHVPKAITAKVTQPKATALQTAQSLGLSSIPVERVIAGKKQTVVLTSAKLGTIINDALTQFCKTHAAYPAPRHISLPTWLNDNDTAQLQTLLYPALERRWREAIDPRHQGGIGHDVYLKLWTLSNPVIPADFVLFDEAQDADPLMMGVLMNQACQTIYVGDAHQQIYEWRGAINAMKRLPYPATLLTQSFRFGEKIADIANVFLKALQEPIPLRGNLAIHSSVETQRHISHKHAVLCRTNATAMSQLLRGLKLGHKVALQADSQRILKFCQGAESLQAGKTTNILPELAYFKHWKEVQAFAETGDGADLKTWVKLVEEHGTKTMITAINQLTPPESADYIVSTAHKSKGLEWGRVQLGDDFRYETNNLSVKISPEELRLLYVACTRAKEVLDIKNILPLVAGLKSKKLIYQ